MRNWAGTFEFSAGRIHHPVSIGELQELVAATPHIKAFGSRHSFNALADSPTDLVSLDALPDAIRIGTDSVTVGGATTYGQVAPLLDRAGLALANLASLPHIAVVGACATATHGSGEHNQNLSAAVRSLDLIKADGSLLTLRRGDEGFAGAVVGLGALGIVTSITLDTVPAFQIAQTVYDDLPLDAALAHFDEIQALGYSVSLFTNWRAPVFNLLWVKAREPLTDTDILGARRADGPRNPIPGAPADNTTVQLGVPGPWYERLPHFRLDFRPSTGAEIQSEYLMPREHAVPALRALAGLADQITPLLQTCEVRTIAADDSWLSTAYGRPSVAFHFTWHKRPDDLVALLPVLEAALAPYDARPHWGKVFTMAPAAVQGRYSRLVDFRALAADLDPGRKFGNDVLDTYIYT